MMDRNYEGMIILEPTLSDEAVEKEARDFTLIFPEGAVTCQNLGRKKFAYPIKKQIQGCYLLYNFRADAGKRTEFEQKIRLNPAVLRYLIIHALRAKKEAKNAG